jgi:Domain of unknown function (DUF4129)
MAAGPIGRIPAQRLARQELSKGIYNHESFWQWLSGKLNVNVAGPVGWWGIVALVAVLVAVAVVVWTGIGPVGRSRRRPGPALLGGADPVTAREHRELARRHAADGDYSGAIVEGVRAIAADLEERALLVLGPARTADELAREAGSLFPDRAAELTAAARLFDDVYYGARAGTPESFALVQRLDEALTSTKAPVSR